ncbi:MAG: hypothetical protein HQL19_08875, partial [Candidatus Omnitrophica bacterium]|nr:hypothetical protein [Candidatus Omnitrophota bacterium]
GAPAFLPVVDSDLQDGTAAFMGRMLNNPDCTRIGIVVNNVGAELVAAAALAVILQDHGKQVCFYVYPEPHMQYDLTIEEWPSARKIIEEVLGRDLSGMGIATLAKNKDRRDFKALQGKVSALVLLGEEAVVDVFKNLNHKAGVVVSPYPVFIIRACKNIAPLAVMTRQGVMYTPAVSDYEVRYFRSDEDPSVLVSAPSEEWLGPEKLDQILLRRVDRFMEEHESLVDPQARHQGLLSKADQDPALVCAIIAAWLDGRKNGAWCADGKLGREKENAKKELTQLVKYARRDQAFVISGRSDDRIYFATRRHDPEMVLNVLRAITPHGSIQNMKDSLNAEGRHDGDQWLKEQNTLEAAFERQAEILFSLNRQNPVAVAMSMAFLKALPGAMRIKGGIVIARKTVIATLDKDRQYVFHLPSALPGLLQEGAELMVFTAACSIRCSVEDGVDKTTVDLRHGLGIVTLADKVVIQDKGFRRDAESVWQNGVKNRVSDAVLARAEALNAAAHQGNQAISFEMVQGFAGDPSHDPYGDYLRLLNWQDPEVRIFLKKVDGDPYAVIGIPHDELKEYLTEIKIPVSSGMPHLKDYDGKVVHNSFHRVEDMVKYRIMMNEYCKRVDQLLNALAVNSSLSAAERCRQMIRQYVYRVKIGQRLRLLYNAKNDMDMVETWLQELGSGAAQEALKEAITELKAECAAVGNFTARQWNSDGVNVDTQTR